MRLNLITRASSQPSRGITSQTLAICALALALLALPLVAKAQFPDPSQGIGVRPELLKDVGVDQKLNESIPLGLTFRDEHGRERAKFGVDLLGVILIRTHQSGERRILCHHTRT